MLAVASDGSIWGWGENGNGQLGNGTKKSVMQPVKTAENIDGNHVIFLRGGKAHTLFLMDDGTVWGCGHNAEGQLGLGVTGKDETQPVLNPYLTNIISIAVGHNHALALDASGHVWAFGYNDCGQIGNGNRKNQAEPYQLPLEGITQVFCGRKFSMAMDQNGDLYGWGDNEYGQLGDASKYKNVLEPQKLSFSGRFTTLACGNASVFGLDTNGTLWAWGRNDYWQLGDNTAGEKNMEPVSVFFPETFTITKIDGFNIHTAVLTDHGAVWQWGACGHGQYGLGTRPWRTLASEACPVNGVMDVVVNTYTSYILTDAGEVFASGGNWYGQAGTHKKISHYVTTWTDTGLNLMASMWEDPENK